MKWYKHDPAAFLEGVIGLTPEERGFYITVIDLLYARDGFNVTDVLVCSATACWPIRWQRVKARLVACGKLKEVDGAISVERALNEISTAIEFKYARVRSGKINDLEKTNALPQNQNPEYTSYAEAVAESQKRKKKIKDHSLARSLASALNGGALTRSPKTSARPTKSKP